MGVDRIKLIACRTLVEEIRGLFPFSVEPISLGAALHLRPELMTNAIQSAIDANAKPGDTVILAYGLCSMGVVGLKSGVGTLVIPRVDDCIALLLGSRDAYRQSLEQEAGTYFLSKGWIDARITLADSLWSMETDYGKERARRIMDRMLRNYTRIVYIEMGRSGEETYKRRARTIAGQFGLEFKTVLGDPGLIGEIAAGRWDERFAVIPPGREVTLEDLLPGA
jgi:hypothetical protein